MRASDGASKQIGTDRHRGALLTVLLTLSILMSLALGEAADFQAGMEAYERGDNAAALRKLRPLAKQGYAPAQYYLGLMYDFGRGVPKDDAEAAKWHRQGSRARDTPRRSITWAPGTPMAWACRKTMLRR